MTALRLFLAGFLTVLVTVSALSDEFEDDYWDEPMAFPNCSAGERYVHSGNSGYCEACPPGSFNAEFRLDVCMKCEYGEYASANGSRDECEQYCTWPYTTFDIGASDSSECVHPDSRTHSSFQMTIYLDVEVSGDLCSSGTAYALYGASNLMFMDGQLTRCSYDGSWSWMRIQATMPQTWGLQAYRFLLMIQDYLPLINDYAGMGSYYAEKIFKYANRAMLNDLSMNLNDTVLHLEDAEVRRFQPSYREHCSDNYYLYYNTSDGNAMCVTQSDYYSLTNMEPVEEQWAYKYAFYYNVTSNMMEGDHEMSRNCNDNAFKQGVRTIFDNTNYYNNFTKNLSCFNESQPLCRIDFWDCVTVFEMGENVTRAVLIMHSVNDITSSFTHHFNETVSGMEDMWYHFDYSSHSDFSSCPNGAVSISGDLSNTNDTASSSGGWTTIERDLDYQWDMQVSGLEIKTSSGGIVGSGAHIMFKLFESDRTAVASVNVNLESPSSYKIGRCMNGFEEFPTQPSTAGIEDVWRFEKTSEKFHIYCNGVLLVSYTYADSDNNNCVPKWSDDIQILNVPASHDTASEYLREIPSDHHSNCSTCAPGYFPDNNMMCRHCPFHTYSPDSGSQCNSCPFNSTTPYWGMNGSDSCVLHSNYYEDYGWYFDMEGKNYFDLDIRPTLDLCPVTKARSMIGHKCQELYPSGTKETPTSVQEYVCMVGTYSSYIIEALCGVDFNVTFNEIWRDIMHGEDAEDIAVKILCYVGMGFVEAERNYDSSSSDCPSDDVRYLRLNFTLHNMSLTATESQWAFPILTAAQNLETMNFTDFSGLMYGVMARFGMDHWSQMMEGFDMAEEMYEMVGTLPGMVRMEQMRFTGNYGGRDSFYCANGNVRRDCPYYLTYDNAYENCYGASEGDVIAMADECNDCNVTFYYVNETSREYPCGECFPTNITNGYLDHTSADGADAYYECYDGYMFELSQYGSCLNWAWCGMSESRACVANNCTYPDLENGYISYTVNDTSCPYAVYRCNSGYEMDGYQRVKCQQSQSAMQDDLPSCYAVCAFTSTITNGDIVREYYDSDGDREAWYQCDSGYYPYFVDARCRYDDSTGSLVTYSQLRDQCTEMDCSLPSTYYNAELSEQYYMNYETFGEYTCPSGYVQEGYGYSTCDDNEADATIRCDPIGCDYSDYGVSNGYVFYEQNGAKWYTCDEGYEIYGDNRASCDNGVITYPVCKLSDSGEYDEDCEMPDYIYGGYKTWDSETTTDVFDFDSSTMRVAKYACLDGMAMVSNMELMEWGGMPILEAYGTALCIYNSSMSYMPHCRKAEEAGHCGLPDYIDGGYAYNFTTYEDNMLAPQYANYTCYDGFMLMNAGLGTDMGWCRDDYSREMPYCVNDYDWFQMVFHLNNMGMTKYGSHAGRVSVQKVTQYGSESWVTGCDDDFNDNAAGAICRSLGYNFGKQLEAPSRMGTLDYEFGWTNVHCDYDDTIMTSTSCNADEYGEGPLCQPSEQVVVTCFDEEFNTEISVRTSNRKMFCEFEVEKEDEDMNLRNVDLDVQFFRWDSDGTNYSEMNNDEITYRKKKGYKIKYSGDTPDCYSCSVHTNGHFLGEAFNSHACKEVYMSVMD